jgi:hypothetical protein
LSARAIRVIAATALAAVSMRVGYSAGQRDDSRVDSTDSHSLRVQESGHVFVSALNDMTADSTVSPDVRLQGRDAAMAAILAAATTLARNQPSDSTVGRVVQLIQTARSAALLARASGS